MFFEGVHICLRALTQGGLALRRGVRFNAEGPFSVGTSPNPASSAAMG